MKLRSVSWIVLTTSLIALTACEPSVPSWDKEPTPPVVTKNLHLEKAKAEAVKAHAAAVAAEAAAVASDGATTSALAQPFADTAKDEAQKAQDAADEAEKAVKALAGRAGEQEALDEASKASQAAVHAAESAKKASDLVVRKSTAEKTLQVRAARAARKAANKARKAVAAAKKSAASTAIGVNEKKRLKAEATRLAVEALALENAKLKAEQNESDARARSIQAQERAKKAEETRVLRDVQSHASSSLGFRNLGSTCFANAALNLLLRHPQIKDFAAPHATDTAEQKAFREAFFNLMTANKEERAALTGKSGARVKSMGGYHDLLDNLFSQYRRFLKATTGSEEFTSGLRLGSDQGDAQEFIVGLLGGLDFEATLAGLDFAPRSDVKFVEFDGGDRRLMGRAEPLSSLHIGIHGNNIQEALEAALGRSRMSGADLIAHPDTGVLEESYSRDLILAGAEPSFLMMTVKRFEGAWPNLKKNTTELPILGQIMLSYYSLLDPNLLNALTTEPSPRDHALSSILDLQAVVVHHGGLRGGHYYAYTHDKALKGWFKHDDSSVTFTADTDTAGIHQIQQDMARDAYVVLYTK